MSIGYVDQLGCYLSGGYGNTSPGASLGGAFSGHLVDSQAVSGTPFSGVSLVKAYGNAVGDGTLDYTVGDNTLRWKDKDNQFGDAVEVLSDNEYALRSDVFGTLRVNVVASNLPVSNANSLITIANIQNEIYSDISYQQHYSGLVRHVCLFIKNESTKTLKVYLWIDQQPSSGDNEDLLIGLDAAANNQAATQINDTRNTPPNVLFFNPHQISEALNMNLFAGDYKAFWVKLKTYAKDQQVIEHVFANLAVAAEEA